MRRVITGAMLLLVTACGDAPRYERAPAAAAEVQALRVADTLDLDELRRDQATEDVQRVPATSPPAKAKSTDTSVERGIDARIAPPRVVVPEVAIDTRIWPRPDPHEDIYAPIDAVSPPPLPPVGIVARVPEERPRPLPSPERSERQPSFSIGALGIGAAGFGLATLGITASQDDPDKGTLIFSGVSLAIGVGAFAVGGIVYLIETDDAEPTRVGVGLGSLLVDGSF